MRSPPKAQSPSAGGAWLPLNLGRAHTHAHNRHVDLRVAHTRWPSQSPGADRVEGLPPTCPPRVPGGRVGCGEHESSRGHLTQIRCCFHNVRITGRARRAVSLSWGARCRAVSVAQASAPSLPSTASSLLPAGWLEARALPEGWDTCPFSQGSTPETLILEKTLPWETFSDPLVATEAPVVGWPFYLVGLCNSWSLSGPHAALFSKQMPGPSWAHCPGQPSSLKHSVNPHGVLAPFPASVNQFTIPSRM